MDQSSTYMHRLVAEYYRSEIVWNELIMYVVAMIWLGCLALAWWFEVWWFLVFIPVASVVGWDAWQTRNEAIVSLVTLELDGLN
jgi:hypothetical protein